MWAIWEISGQIWTSTNLKCHSHSEICIWTEYAEIGILGWEIRIFGRGNSPFRISEMFDLNLHSYFVRWWATFVRWWQVTSDMINLQSLMFFIDFLLNACSLCVFTGTEHSSTCHTGVNKWIRWQTSKSRCSECFPVYVSNCYSELIINSGGRNKDSRNREKHQIQCPTKIMSCLTQFASSFVRW